LLPFDFAVGLEHIEGIKADLARGLT